MDERSTQLISDLDIRTDDMPEAMRLLLVDYPRDSWESHVGFKDLTKQWLGAHQMFRRLSATLRIDAERYLDKKISNEEYVNKLSYRGGALVNSLHGHHNWEDHSYFPELSAADSRFNAGLEILEKDHEVLNEVLDIFTKAANATIRRIQLDNAFAENETGELQESATAIETLLNRHLSDEEELAVPIILHHRLRG